MIAYVPLFMVLPGVLLDDSDMPDPLSLGSDSVTHWDWDQVIRRDDTLMGYSLIADHIQGAGFEWPFWIMDGIEGGGAVVVNFEAGANGIVT